MDKFYFERECRTRSSECYTVLYGEESVGRLDIHFADNVVHASLNVLTHVTPQQIQELIDSMDEDLCEAVGVTKEEIVVHVHQGKDLGVFSVSDNFNHGSGRK